MDAHTIKKAIHAIRDLMDANRDHLIRLDSAIGDGDLGLTMTRAFAAADEIVAESEETDVGKLLARAGMAMAKAAPSTMGTLVATGFMRGGKAVTGSDILEPVGVATFFRAFAEGVKERGKSKPGEKTVVDVFEPVAQALEGTNGGHAERAQAAIRAAYDGLAATTEMIAQHGKAAVFREQTRGKQDPGATAGVFIIEGFFAATGDTSAH
jgi:phosphoenolpyruvate---glycerone phosphotransferase subunit DhaL